MTQDNITETKIRDYGGKVGNIRRYGRTKDELK